MENLTHSLIGAVLAEATLPSGATARQRTAFYGAGILAANLPDADLLYTSITPPPLGYLLHHRGHTHTVLGLVGLGLIIWLITRIPRLRDELAGAERHFRGMVGVALASHLIADSWNSYGVHPFWPLDNRWFYGDAIYILEPWLWILLGVSVALNARRRGIRLLLAAALIALPLVGTRLGLLSAAPIGVLAVVAALMVLALRRRTPRSRAWVSLAASTGFVIASFIASGIARSRALTSLPHDERTFDIILNPNPANPLCWNALALRRAGDVIEFARSVIPVARFACRPTPWSTSNTQSIAELNTLSSSDCRVRAWLQFGRAPVIDGDWIADARYGGAGSGNFSAMHIAPAQSASDCPPHLTAWGVPRADVLTETQ